MLLDLGSTITQYARLPCGSGGKESTCNVGDSGSVPGFEFFEPLCKGLQRVGHNWATNIFTLVTQYGLPWWLRGKESACQCRRCRFYPWVGKITWRKKWQPLQYSCLRNPIDRGAWQDPVHGVAKELDTTWWLNSKNVTWYDLILISQITIAKTVFPNKFTLWCSRWTEILEFGVDPARFHTMFFSFYFYLLFLTTLSLPCCVGFL